MKKSIILFSSLFLFVLSVEAQLKVDALGYVGIGTSSPDRTLHLTKPDGLVQLRLERTESYTGICDIGTGNNDFMVFPGGYSNGCKFFVSDAGRAGFGSGTTEPLGILSLDYSFAAGKLLTLERNDAYYSDFIGHITITGATGGSGMGFYVSDDNGSSWSKMLFMDGEHERVGICDFYPDYTLDVNGNARIQEDLFVNGNQYTDFAFTVNGSGYSTSDNWTGSDSSLKRDIKIFEDTYSKNLFELNGYTYKLKSKDEIAYILDIHDKDSVPGIEKELTQRDIDFMERTRVGLLAQEVKQYYPDLIKEDKNGIMALNYNGFIPIIIEALKEQQAIIESQGQRITALENPSILNEDYTKSYTTISGEETSSNQLYQNSPNPFSQNTEIKFFIENTAQRANIYIYNLQGIQINSYSIMDRENSSLIINSSELQAGTYLYTLIVDGREVDTKKMILTE